jgi:hypothetical protein
MLEMGALQNPRVVLLSYVDKKQESFTHFQAHPQERYGQKL